MRIRFDFCYADEDTGHTADNAIPNHNNPNQSAAEDVDSDETYWSDNFDNGEDVDIVYGSTVHLSISQLCRL